MKRKVNRLRKNPFTRSLILSTPSVSAFVLCVLLAALAPTYWTSLSVPGYPDEFAHLKYHSHSWAGWPTFSTHFPQCTSATGIPVPVSQILGEALHSLTLGRLSKVRHIRWVGLGLLMLWFVLFWRLARKLTPDRETSYLCLIGAAGMLSLGVQPFIDVLLRPEIASAATIVGITLMLSSEYPFSRPRLTFVTVIALTSVLISLHPKNIFFLPYVLIAALPVFWKCSRWAGLSFLAFALLAAVEALHLQAIINSCAEFPGIKAAFWNQYLDPAAILKEPLSTLPKMVFNIVNSTAYVENISFLPKHVIDWLPPLDASAIDSVNRLRLNCAIEIAIGVTALGIVLAAIYQIPAALVRRGSVGRRELMSLSLLLALLTITSLQISKNFYEISLLLPLLLLMGILTLNANSYLKKVLRIATYLTAPVAVASQIYLVKTYRGDLLRAYGGPNIPLSVQEDAKIIAEIEAAKRACGFSNSTRTSHLIVDDLTYGFMRKTSDPYFITYINWFEDLSGHAPEFQISSLAEKLGVAGYLIRCSEMPPQFHLKMAVMGSICCLPGQELRPR